MSNNVFYSALHIKSLIYRINMEAIFIKAIYKITNKLNGKSYIGQSKHPEQRWDEHCYKHTKYKSLISQAIQRYGRENFDFEILGWFEDYNEKERDFIQIYNSLAPDGYNFALKTKELPYALV